MCRWFMLLGLLFAFRSLTIAATVLPNPDSTCKAKVSHPDNLWYEAGTVMFSWDKTCQDSLYSGHVVIITLSALFIVWYQPKAPWSASVLIDQFRVCSTYRLIQVSCAVYIFVGYYSMIVSHKHYTCDVFLGALVTSFVFIGYEHVIQVAPLQKSMIFGWILWFEELAPDMKLGLQVASSRFHAMKQVDVDISCELLQEASPSSIVQNELDHLMNRYKLAANGDSQNHIGDSPDVGVQPEYNRHCSVDQMKEMVEAYDVGSHTLPSFWSDPLGCKDLQWNSICKFFPRVVFAVFMWLACMYANCFSQAVLQRDMSNYYESHWKPLPPTKGPLKLYDLGQELFPYLSAAKYPLMSPDTVASSACNFVVVRFWLLPGPMSLRWTIFCRWFLLRGLMFRFRSFSIIATALPNPDYTCKPRITYPENLGMEAMAVVLRMDLTCQDVLYSGHTVAITMAMLFIAKYSPKSPLCHNLFTGVGWFSRHSMLQVGCIIYCIFGYYCIIASHFHFTVDVFVAALMCFFVFVSYHHAIEVAPLKLRSMFSPYRFLLWFEHPALDMGLWHKVAGRRLEAMLQSDAELSREILQEAPPTYVVNSGLPMLVNRSFSGFSDAPLLIMTPRGEEGRLRVGLSESRSDEFS